MFSEKSVLITGGTGSFGQAFAKRLIANYPEIRRIVIFSRDELKQFEMQCKPEFSNNKKIRFFIGDVRDPIRLKRALEGIDFVVHAAALKQVPAAEYNPFEAIKTNIMGAQNIIEASLDSDVSRVIALSTDKAAAPVNLYGATKLCSDKLFTAANGIIGSRNLRFGVVRYGNVMGSRGSVIPFFNEQKKTGILPITHPDMTRFNITLDEGVDMVFWAFENLTGGETFVPRIPSYRIMDVAEAICPDCKKPVVGIRPGEKIHEEMITESDATNTVDLGKYFAILPSYQGYDFLERYISDHAGATPYTLGAYSSDKNSDFLTISQIKKLLALV